MWQPSALQRGKQRAARPPCCVALSLCSLTHITTQTRLTLPLLGQLCSIAGIMRGMLEAASFPCTVSAVTVPVEGAPRDKTVFVITFENAA